MSAVTLSTIGFTQKTAERFFDLLERAKVQRIIDVRLNNEGQLAGFAKKRDLAYFSRKLLGIEYLHLPLLAPTEEMLTAYKKRKGSWDEYEKRFLHLMETRKIEEHLSREVLDKSCLLCSEDKPHFCHRRLIAEYLGQRWGNVAIQHLA